MRNKSSQKRLFTNAQRLIPGGVTSPVRYFTPNPFFVKKANGSTIWDTDNHKYIDFCNGYGALFLGHRPKEIIRAVKSQLSCGTMYCTPTPQETTLVELINSCFPSMKKVRLVNTGSEATMTAIRLARAFTKRNKIIKFEGCYHGAHESVLVKAGSGLAHRGISVSEGGLEAVSKNTLVVQYNNFEQLEKTVLKNSDDIAAVIMEPILANMGLILPEKNFIKKIRALTRKHGILLIFDEAVTGFRVSVGGAQKFFGVSPDITTLAKALGGGFAIAAVGGRANIMNLLSPAGGVYQASTFAGNPVAVSAAISSVGAIKKIQNTVYAKLERYCAHLSRAIDDIATDYNISHQINFTSSMLQIFFTNKPVVDYATSKAADTKKFHKMFGVLLDQGIFIAPSQYETIFLSNAHSTSDLNKTISAYDTALRAVKN